MLLHLFEVLTRDADWESVSIDSTSIKVHTLVDGVGNPLRFLLSPGNDHDAVHAERLIKGLDLSGSTMLGDKAYGA